MTKEQFALAAEGAGFRPLKEIEDAFEHPERPLDVVVWWNDPLTMKVAVGEYLIVCSTSLQRLTHLFKAFQV